jgi:hypothetical protein
MKNFHRLTWLGLVTHIYKAESCQATPCHKSQVRSLQAGSSQVRSCSYCTRMLTRHQIIPESAAIRIGLFARDDRVNAAPAVTTCNEDGIDLWMSLQREII